VLLLVLLFVLQPHVLVLVLVRRALGTVSLLLEDFDEQLEPHLFDDSDQQIVELVVEHRRHLNVLAAETRRRRLSLYNQRKHTAFCQPDNTHSRSRRPLSPFTAGGNIFARLHIASAAVFSSLVNR